MNYISFDNLDKYNVINCYTKKPYNFNFRVLSEEEVSKSLDSLSNELNYHFDKYVFPIQSHTTNVEIVDESNVDSVFNDVDGVLTNLKGVALGTMSGDCQTILVYDKVNNVVGSIHSGWKGTLNGIITVAIKKMIDYYHSNVDDIEVVICPSILDCCFEVEDDVQQLFLNKYGSKYIRNGMIREGKQKYFIDLISINVDVLHSLGIKNINASNICVKCNSKDFHSFRADGKEAGRNIGLIGLRK